MPLKTYPFDAAEFLGDPAAQTRLIADAVASGEAGYIAAALGAIARARGMTEIAKEAGVTRVALYKSLVPDGDPKLSTLLGVMRAIGAKLSVEPPANVVAMKPRRPAAIQSETGHRLATAAARPAKKPTPRARHA